MNFSLSPPPHAPTAVHASTRTWNRLRASAVLGCALLSSLVGCSTLGNYSDEAPATGWGITGIWVLNPALSTDTAKALAELTPKQRRQRPQGGPPGSTPGMEQPPDPLDPNSEPGIDPTTGQPTGSGPQDGPGGGPDSPGGSGGPDGQGGSGGPGGSDSPDGQGGSGGHRRAGRSSLGGGQQQGQGRMVWHPPLDLQNEVLEGGEWLQIGQRDADLVVTNAKHSRSYTPGQRSVVSVETGVADQTSGWKGRDYIVDLKPQIGPHILERYSLSADGRQLVVHINVDSEGPNKALKVVRVYDHADAIPHAAASTH